jgi:hypothetical protein
MRSIAKGPEPRALIQWKADNAATPENLRYGAAGFPREAVRQALLAEQFHLCAYTMRRLRTAAECTAGRRHRSVVPCRASVAAGAWHCG